MTCPNCHQEIITPEERDFITEIGYCYSCDKTIGENEVNLREEENGETENDLFHRG